MEEEWEQGEEEKDVGSEQGRATPITSPGACPNRKSHPGACSLGSVGLLAAPPDQGCLVYMKDLKPSVSLT